MCGICEVLYDDEIHLFLHINKDHADCMNDRLHNTVYYECNICNKSYLRKMGLIKHMKYHTTIADTPGEDGILERCKIFINRSVYYKCNYCNLVITNRPSFIRHLRIHTNERPVMCEKCGKQFRIDYDLKRHIDDVHRKIKKYACDICNTMFAAKGTRDAHRRIHTGEKPFICSICGKRCRSIQLLRSHKLIHGDHRPHKCRYCEKAFRDKQKLTIHECIHTGIRPHPCDMCDKRFAAKGEMVRHRKVHFSMKPFLCAICGLNFRFVRYLRTHIKHRHADKADELLKALERD